MKIRKFIFWRSLYMTKCEEYKNKQNHIMKNEKF